MGFGTSIATKILENQTELRRKYLQELRNCIQSNESSKTLEKLVASLGYAAVKVEEDEQSMRKLIGLHADLERVKGLWEQNGKDQFEWREKLIASNKALIDATNAQRQADVNFIVLQKGGDNLFFEYKKFEKMIELLAEYEEQK